MRLFVGTFLSSADQNKLAELSNYKDKLEDIWQQRIRLVRPEKLHLTWLFLGDIEKDMVPLIDSQLKQTIQSKKSCQMNYSRPEFWPNQEKARHLVITPETIPDAVIDIQHSIAKSIGHFSKQPENKPYNPHLTLLRFSQEPENALSLPAWLPPENLLPIAHDIDNICLIESNLGKDKNDYSLLSQYKLSI